MTTTSTARDRLTALTDELKGRFVRRDEVIDGIMVAAVAGMNAVQLGAPGTAKTALATAFARGLGVTEEEHYALLLTRFTSPEEVFGPISFSGLKEDRYERIVAGYLPSAKTAFLDEVFKASPAILNSLLTALNERRFRNGAGWSDMPLSFVLAASNEYPEGSHLQALWDRFQVRFWLEYVQGSADRTAIRRARGDADMPALAALDDLAFARAGARGVAVPSTMDGVFCALFDSVEKATEQPISDRKIRQCERLAQASAWLRGSDTVEPCDLAVLEHVLWEHHDQRAKVAAEVAKFATSAVQEVDRIMRALKSLVATTPTPDQISRLAPTAKEDAKTRLMAVADELKAGSTKIGNITAKTAREKARVEDAQAEIQQHLKDAREVYASLAFGI